MGGDMTERSDSQNKTPVTKNLLFDQPVINIGSHPENDLVLTGLNVAPFHAMLTYQEGEYFLTSLAPEVDIFLDGRPLRTTQVKLAQKQHIDIGEYALDVKTNGNPPNIQIGLIEMGAVQAPVALAGKDGEQSILARNLSQPAEIEVEQTANYDLEIINAGSIVASFNVSVQGIPEDWVQISPRIVNLNEGQRAVIKISITPPRAPTSTAGKHTPNAVVASPNYPKNRSVTPLELTILPYYEFILGNLSPRQQHIRWRKHFGQAVLPITNLGNNSANFDIMALDDENGCSFDFQVDENLQLNKQAKISVPAGNTSKTSFNITPIKQPLIALSNKQYHYTTTVQVSEQAVSPQIMSGSVISHPFFGWFSIFLAFVLTIAGLFFLLQPRIHYFQVAGSKDVIELGDTTNLEWSVSPFATRLSISGITEPIANGQTHLTITPDQSTTYEMVAGNWLSGMMGLDRKASQTVLVVPPSPKIAVFDISESIVNKGAPVKVRWSVAKADTAILTVDQVVYELKKEEFSGEKDILLEKDALITLEAKSLSGSELRSIFVSVVPPYITVAKFTVWVRPQAGTTASVSTQGSAVTAALNDHFFNPLPSGIVLASAHDPSRIGQTTPPPAIPPTDFPNKFVELIPDSGSDTGYSVKFYEPDRELAKGEQVMVEWEVNGVDTVSIAPFTEILPSKGLQPFFPQESMNFVMTAKSGELEKLFMLPVNVFNGEPPKAPTIEFFTAAPSKMVGGGEVQFAWSVTGAWTHVQISSLEAIIADWINAQGFKKINVSKTGSYLLTAWNGTLSSSKIIEVTVDPSLKTPALSIIDVYPDTQYFRVGDTVNVFINITGDSNSPAPSGTVIVSDGYASCPISLPQTFCALTFNTPSSPGVSKLLKASYGGDKIYASVDSAAYTLEKIYVEPNKITLSPKYYYAENSAKTTAITNIATASLIVGQGLYLDISVVPVNKSLEDDKKGQILARYCPIDASNNIIQSSCISAGPATVSVPTSGTGSGVSAIGNAVIVIHNLLTAGKNALLLSYNHLDGAFDPVLLGSTVDDRIEFTVGKGDLLLVPQGSGVGTCNYKECTLDSGLGKTVIFDPRLMAREVGIPSDIMVDLYSTFPLPSVLSVTVKTLAGTQLPSWTDLCKWEKAGSYYQLICTGVDLTENINITYAFTTIDPNYEIKSRSIPITLSVKKPTSIILNGSLFTDVYVGEVLELQKGNIYVKEVLAGTDIPNAVVHINTTGTGAPAITEVIGIINPVSGSCDFDGSNGLRIKQTAAYSTIDTCQVYFKKAGPLSFYIDYAGDPIFASTNLTSNPSPGKQTGISVTWTVAPTNTWTWNIFTDYTVNLAFDCPNSALSTSPCYNFTNLALSEAKLLLAQTTTGSECTVYEGTSSTPLTGTFTLSASPPPTASLKLRCLDMTPKTLNLSFGPPSSDSFEGLAGKTQTVTVSTKTVTITPDVRISNSTTANTFNDSYPTVVSSGAISNLWVLDEYWVVVRLDMPADASPITGEYILMDWPLELDAGFSIANTSCSKVIGHSGQYQLDLTQKSSTVWEAKCEFIFGVNVTLNPTDQIDFTLASTRFTASKATIDLPSSVEKRTATMTSQVRVNETSNSGIYSDSYRSVVTSGNMTEFYVGDEYWVVVTLLGSGVTLDDNPMAGDEIVLTIPAVLEPAFPPGSTDPACSTTTGTGIYHLSLTKKTGVTPTTWEAKCKVKANTTITIGSSKSLSFALATARYKATGASIGLPNNVSLRTVTMTPHVYINNTSTPSTTFSSSYPMVDSGGAVANLYVGEEYWINVTLDNVVGTDNPGSGDYIIVDWPGELDGYAVTSSICLKDSGAGKLKLLLQKKSGSTPTAWEGRCQFIITKVGTLSTPQRFRFSLTSSRYAVSSSNITIPASVIKRDVTLSITLNNGEKTGESGKPNYYYAGCAIDIVINVSDNHYLQNISTELSSSNLVIGFGPDATSISETLTCSGYSTGTITCPISGKPYFSSDKFINAGFDGTGSTYFKSATASVSGFRIKAIPVKIIPQATAFYEEMKCKNCSKPPWYFIRGDTDYPLTVSIEADVTFSQCTLSPVVNEGNLNITLAKTGASCSTNYKDNVSSGSSSLVLSCSTADDYTSYHFDYIDNDAEKIFEDTVQTISDALHVRTWLPINLSFCGLTPCNASHYNDGVDIHLVSSDVCLRLNLEGGTGWDYNACEGDQNCWNAEDGPDTSEQIAVFCTGSSYAGSASDGRICSWPNQFDPTNGPYQVFALSDTYIWYEKK
jgi:hypothetical protein